MSINQQVCLLFIKQKLYHALKILFNVKVITYISYNKESDLSYWLTFMLINNVFYINITTEL